MPSWWAYQTPKHSGLEVHRGNSNCPGGREGAQYESLQRQWQPVLEGEVGSGDVSRPGWLWVWHLGTQALLSPLHPSLCDLERERK